MYLIPNYGNKYNFITISPWWEYWNYILTSLHAGPNYIYFSY